MTEHRRALLAAAFLALACSDRQISIDEGPFEPLCMRSWGTQGYWLDGTQHRIHHEGNPDAISPYVCTCITEEQFWDDAEINRLTDELLDELLIECERSAALEGFDWDDCKSDYSSGGWRPAQLGIGPQATPFSCEGEGWPGYDEPPVICELGDPGCSCTVEAFCDGGSTCVDGMCQMPP